MTPSATANAVSSRHRNSDSAGGLVATNNEDKDVFAFEQFRGLRNTVGAESFEAGDLEAALNVDITDALRVRRRKGYGATAITTSHHSLWSNGVIALAVSGSTLVEILPDLTSRVVRTGLTVGLRMHYASIGTRVFYSNNVETGVFEDGVSRSWGVQWPTRLPLASVIGGSLPAGLYQYVLTYLREDGQESGVGLAGVIELTGISGIRFYDIPVSPDAGVSFKRLYVSPVNGDALFALMTLPNSAVEATYTIERTGALPLGTQFLSPALPGTDLAEFAGYILMARGNVLYRSEPFAPELFDLRKGLPFAGRITLVAPVDDGVYLGTESEVIWLSGRKPAEWLGVQRLNYGVIPGTLAQGLAEDIAEGQQGPAALFATTNGICAGLNGGSVLNLTGDRFNYPVMDEGAAVVRDLGGSVQYLVTLRGTERPGNTAF
jgi:hypothetical protein